ncbi:MAG: MBL fold metallo-hydrolase [Longimicrobiales bacterium]|nr:MBL fold metallo-hydrolase [Longimicrobiales bacterium]
MEIQTFTGRGFGENAYLAICEETQSCVAVDPGAGAGDLLRAISSDGLALEAIFLTHAHLDHIEGVSTVRSAHPDVPIWLHPDDLGLYRGVQRQAAMFGLSAEAQPEPTDRIVPGEPLNFGSCAFEVRFTPGHAPGHVILVSEDDGLALVGDVVFQGSIGRTDLPGGDMQTLMRSIREHVLTLPDETTLYPGHGPPTTVGQERLTNPFLAAHYGGELA